MAPPGSLYMLIILSPPTQKIKKSFVARMEQLIHLNVNIRLAGLMHQTCSFGEGRETIKRADMGLPYPFIHSSFELFPESLPAHAQFSRRGGLVPVADSESLQQLRLGLFLMSQFSLLPGLFHDTLPCQIGAPIRYLARHCRFNSVRDRLFVNRQTLERDSEFHARH